MKTLISLSVIGAMIFGVMHNIAGQAFSGMTASLCNLPLVTIGLIVVAIVVIAGSLKSQS